MRERQKNRFFCLQKKFNYKFGKENAFFHRQHKKNSLMHRKLFFHGRSKEFFFLLLPEQKVCLPKREFFLRKAGVFSLFFASFRGRLCMSLFSFFWHHFFFKSSKQNTSKKDAPFSNMKGQMDFSFFCFVLTSNV